ncbi:FtsX-like permease family protein [uncultured Bacteroides sp.]|uniref:ABC transporter permease n=1 Tax=uncultured Bacteroides sp. TaxID=162156 RepID=UPI002AAA7979|nr:FtsX-like permease family protein [uncultured Bacteroides sp.]
MNMLLLKQIWNERKSNAWLWIELLLVTVVLWFVVDMCYVSLRTYFQPKGFDISNTYLIKIASLPPHNPDYRDEKEKKTTGGEDLLEIVNRLKKMEGVEAVSLSSNSYPYNGSNSYFGLSLDTMNVGTLRREITPDFFKVFRYEGSNGESSEKLASLLKDGTLIVSDNLFLNSYGLKGEDLLGKTFHIGSDTTQRFVVAAVTKPVRYNDFRSIYDSRYTAILMSEKYIAGLGDVYASFLELCLRVNPAYSVGFTQRLRKMADKQLRVGNLFLGKFQSMEAMRKKIHMDDMNELRNQMWGIGFLLFNIFLGLLGTFWFRTQHRRSEMALHLTFGSTKKQVFNRLILEGMLLLVTAMLVGIIISLNIAYMGYLNQMDGKMLSLGRFLITMFITFILMSITILIGISFPARQAMKIQPAEALHEE